MRYAKFDGLPWRSMAAPSGKIVGFVNLQPKKAKYGWEMIHKSNYEAFLCQKPRNHSDDPGGQQQLMKCEGSLQQQARDQQACGTLRSYLFVLGQGSAVPKLYR